MRAVARHQTLRVAGEEAAQIAEEALAHVLEQDIGDDVSSLDWDAVVLPYLMANEACSLIARLVPKDEAIDVCPCRRVFRTGEMRWMKSEWRDGAMVLVAVSLPVARGLPACCLAHWRSVSRRKIRLVTASREAARDALDDEAV